MDLSTISTADLVTELSKREAVERVDVPPYDILEIGVYSKDSDECLYEKETDGPQIVLRIWD